jgi:hypothetical protein
MELGLTRAPLRRGFDAEPNDALPPVYDLGVTTRFLQNCTLSRQWRECSASLA